MIDKLNNITIWCMHHSRKRFFTSIWQYNKLNGILVCLNVVFVLQAWGTRSCCWDCLLGYCNYISAVSLRRRLHCMLRSVIFLTFTNYVLCPETCLTAAFVVSCCSGLLNIMQHWHQSVLWFFLDLLMMFLIFHGECMLHVWQFFCSLD